MRARWLRMCGGVDMRGGCSGIYHTRGAHTRTLPQVLLSYFRDSPVEDAASLDFPMGTVIGWYRVDVPRAWEVGQEREQRISPLTYNTPSARHDNNTRPFAELMPHQYGWREKHFSFREFAPLHHGEHPITSALGR